ncbi:MAG TPA: hypothetical protein VHW23_42385 [Kofleriaceae bacterium]|jgi:hypothetical protein|nr:hypothetical protein [Kofleriaceae bacterium]
MAENTKMPPNQDQGRTPANKPMGGPGKPQKSGGTVPTSPDRDRQGVNQPGKPVPEIDPDRVRPDRTKPVPGKDGSIGGDDLDDDELTPPIDRE